VVRGEEGFGRRPGHRREVVHLALAGGAKALSVVADGFFPAKSAFEGALDLVEKVLRGASWARRCEAATA
jgi:hypothetical protein